MTAPEAPRRARRVVIVEDNHATADSLRQLLDLCGYEVKVAYTGPDGVRTAEDWPPDFVPCDLGLPGLDGDQVAAALRQHPATATAHLFA
jgi:CheY-like chemotaxis protein